jgi:short-subunit dehydrogenase
MLAEPGLAAYNASKFAVVAVSESLQHDLTLRGAPLAVSVLCPGWVKTRIADAERHRAPGERTDLGKLDDVTLKIGSTIRKAVEAGISAEQVAAAVFEAVDKERFYILTHPRTLAGIKIRMEDILNNRQPTLLPL